MDGWLDSLSIGRIGKDFSSDSPDQIWTRWIEAAFAMPSAIATGNGLNTLLKGLVGFAVSGLTEVSLTSTSGDQVDTKSVENRPRNIVGVAGSYVAGVLTNATGNGNADMLAVYLNTDYVYGTSWFWRMTLFS